MYKSDISLDSKGLFSKAKRKMTFTHQDNLEFDPDLNTIDIEFKDESGQEKPVLNVFQKKNNEETKKSFKPITLKYSVDEEKRLKKDSKVSIYSFQPSIKRTKEKGPFKGAKIPKSDKIDLDALV